jgi:hypothetical protein
VVFDCTDTTQDGSVRHARMKDLWSLPWHKDCAPEENAILAVNAPELILKLLNRIAIHFIKCVSVVEYVTVSKCEKDL